MIRALMILCLVPTIALADVSCPPSFEGRALARTDGGNLYIGDPAQHMLVAPDQQARSMSGSNVWLTPDAERLTLVCRYGSSKRALAVSLPAGTQRCTQSLSANTFVCR